MPYLVRERVATAGRKMYLIYEPTLRNSVGSWTLSKTEAETWDTQLGARAACAKLALFNAGEVEFISIKGTQGRKNYENTYAKERKVSDADNTVWVIQSNVSGDYIENTTLGGKSREKWTEFIARAMRFDTLKDVREFTAEFIIGISNAPQALDIDYVQIDKMTRKPIAYGSVIEEEQNKKVEYILQCTNSNMYFKAHAAFSKAEKWTLNKREAVTYPNATLASASIIKMAHTPKVRIIEVKTFVNEEELKTMASGKMNFRIKMRHGAGFSVERTFLDLTEAEAVHAMFKEVANSGKTRFDIGIIEAVGPNAAKQSVIQYAQDCKSM